MSSSSYLTLADRYALTTAGFLGFCVAALDVIALIGVRTIFYGRFDLMLVEWSLGTVAAGMLTVWILVSLLSWIGRMLRRMSGAKEPPPQHRLRPALRRTEPTFR